jgi:DNA-binding transcriptional ArsR family regulator
MRVLHARYSAPIGAL